MKIIFATHNLGKVKELKQILDVSDVEVLSADEFGVHEDVVEDGETLQENSEKKARFVFEKTKEWTVADDTGIFISALNGAPGVRSARWAKENGFDQGIMQYALLRMQGVPKNKRSAYFETAVVLISSTGEEQVFVGRVNGSIVTEPRGAVRPTLPYDTIFMPEGHTRTFGEMSDQEKNQLSHRGKAFEKLREFFASK